MRRLRSMLFVPAALFAFAACADEPLTTLIPEPAFASSVTTVADSYVIDFTGMSVPADLASAVAAAGGTLTARMDGIGVAVATSSDRGFAAKAQRIKGVRSITPDLIVQWLDPNMRTAEEVEAGEGLTGLAHEIGGHETFRLLQWAPDAVSAPAAWATGVRGAGARVAIIDGGVHSTHIDIAPNLDVARSASFVPGQPFNADVGTFWHGTHVAGILGAPANNIGTVGIAPDATIIGVKVLQGGSGAFSWVINGIYYAATPIDQGGAGAHIINLSLGALLPKSAPGIAQLNVALAKATTYAYQQGVTVIAALGNDAIDLDHSKDVIFVPAQNPHVIAVSATGPVGFALGATNFDRPASYTNFGQSAVNLAGPGGDFVLPGNDICAIPRLDAGFVIQFCWVFDLVFSTVRGTTNGNYGWAAGTSMAAPAVSGVAALIVGKYGPLHPAQVEALLRRSADDLGKRGNDDFYGHGRVNALRAVQ